MVTLRTARSKGSSHEYDVQYSLSKKFPAIYLTKQRGFQLMWDVQCDDSKMIIECKRLKGISWNALVKFHNKLKEIRPENYSAYVCFRSNHQPCLVFDGWSIKEFKDVFEIPFIKHEPVRRNKNGKRTADKGTDEPKSDA